MGPNKSPKLLTLLRRLELQHYDAATCKSHAENFTTHKFSQVQFSGKNKWQSSDGKISSLKNTDTSQPSTHSDR